MYCHNCGVKLPDDSVFCPNCGQAVPGGTHDTVTPRSRIPTNESMPHTSERIQSLKVAYMVQSGSHIVSAVALFIFYTKHKYDISNATYFSDSAVIEAFVSIVIGMMGCYLIRTIGEVIAAACLRGVFRSKAQILHILTMNVWKARSAQVTTDIGSELADIEPFVVRWKPARQTVMSITGIMMMVITLLFCYHGIA